MALECIQTLRAKSAMRRTLHSELTQFNSKHADFSVSVERDLESAVKRGVEVGKKRKRDDGQSGREKLHALRIEIARSTIAMIFETCNRMSNKGIQLSVAQLTFGKQLVGSILPQLCGGIEIYNILQQEIYDLYGIRYTGKSHVQTAGRRTGKSYGCAFFMAIIACIAPFTKLMFVNLFSHAGLQNLRQMEFFVQLITSDPTINARVEKVEKYNIYIISHMHNYILEKIEEDPKSYGSLRGTIEVSVLTSLPNMDGSGGNVRSLKPYNFTFSRSTMQVTCRNSHARTHIMFPSYVQTRTFTWQGHLLIRYKYHALDPTFS